MKSFNFIYGLLFACGIVCANPTSVYSDYYMDTPVYDESCGCGRFSAYGEFLYWKVVQDQLQYAVSFPDLDTEILGPFEISSDIAQKVVIKDPSFSFKPGFRLGLGYEAPNADWDVQLIWTSLHERQHSHVSETGAIYPVTVPISTSFGTFANEAKSHWHFDMDIIDLQLGKTCSFYGCFNLRPYLGVKGAVIRQKQNVEYFGFSSGDFPVDVTSSKKNDFTGVGPSFGLDSSWTFLTDWSLIGGVSGSLLCGQFDVFTKPSIEIPGSGALAFKIKNSKHNRLRPVLDAHLGLEWQTCFCGGTTVDLGICYEAAYWWNQWQAVTADLTSVTTGGNSSQGDLMTHGITAHLGVSF